MRTSAPLLAPIFRSDGQARLLAEMLLSDEELSLTHLAERAGVAYATAHREVTRLQEAGILTERQAGRTRLIRANQESPLVPPLREILRVTAGPATLLREALAPIDGIESAFLFGSFAARIHGIRGDAPQDIDLMVVGVVEPSAVYTACDRVERLVGRPISPSIFTWQELQHDSGFMQQVQANPTVPVLGKSPLTVEQFR